MTCKHRIVNVPDRTSDGRYPFNVIRSVFFENDWWRVIEFGHPIKQCTKCYRLFGYPFDPQNLPKTDNGLVDEIELSGQAQS